MAWLTRREVLNLKLSTIPAPDLRNLARELGISPRGTTVEVVKRLLDVDEKVEEGIDRFIKSKYREKVKARRREISDEDLKRELQQVNTFSWGVIQGQLDQKIQSEYVRRFPRFSQLLEAVQRDLYKEISSYVICTWFNHWTTVLIEEHIALHWRVVPALKPIKGVDIFFGGQPFDLKVTYLPRNYDPNAAIQDPRKLAVWMYENQGAQRFGADNRLYIVLFNREYPERSWELKRDFDLLFSKMDDFFEHENVTKDDEISFCFGERSYRAVSKILLITREK